MPPLKVAILWHFHQPSYWDRQAEKYRYPWVFLHAARHYHAMAHIAAAHPEMRMTFNFTPVLLEQLEHYVSGSSLDDRILEAILKPAEDLNEEELTLVLEHVFKLHLPTMILPFPRYKELYGLLGDASTRSRRRKITPRDIRDLQVLYLLTWCGVPLQQSDPVKGLMEKEREFTEGDKEQVFQAMLGAVRETVPLYRQLQEKGQIEVTTTPYYHPILPLVINSSSARESRPDVDIGEIDFHHPQDARWHVEEALNSYRQFFQCDARGMWPAEGGVSDAALGLMAEAGLLWAGTDEGILGRSLGKFSLGLEEKYRPYRFIDSDLWVYFRDREISDRIGFVYSGWESGEAVDDVMGRLEWIRNGLPSAEGACVTIILDGENPWEYYSDRGHGFLGGLYGSLVTTDALQPTRFCDHRRDHQDPPSLRHVVPGSWIDANFDTWIGCPEKNLAWKLLGLARRKLETEAPESTVPEDFFRAEGSDWFWWLGPGHDTPYESSYENLFRTNLRRGLEEAGLEPPDILKRAVAIVATPLFQPPLHLATPRIDGRPGNYYDWIAAGYYLASEGSFHRLHRYLERVRFGFDLEFLYLRIEGDLKTLKESLREGTVCVEFQRPEALRLIYSEDTLKRVDANGGSHTTRSRAAHDVFLEMAIPFGEIGAKPGDLLEFSVYVVAAGNTLDRIPQSGHVAIHRPESGFGQENWSV